MPTPIGIFRMAVDAMKRGLDEVIRRKLAAERKGPPTRPPRVERPRPEPITRTPPADEPKRPRPVETRPIVVQATRQIAPVVSSPRPKPEWDNTRMKADQARETAAINRGLEAMQKQAAKNQAAQKARVSTQSKVGQGINILEKALLRRLENQIRSPRNPFRQFVQTEPGKRPILGLGAAEGLKPLQVAQEETEKCWQQCRRTGPKKKRKKRVCVTPAQAAKLGLNSSRGI
ncbi:MAG: hypothetical protein [Circular genetic element sp.]|nr:MAG: hypothetical protein [Circular genetic element sp.]